MRIPLTMLIAALTVGCASQKGIGFSSSEFGVEELVEVRDSQTDETPAELPKALLMIGKVSMLRPLTMVMSEKASSGAE